ncbi:MAG TPA: NAD(P)H-dependent oxidoreductase subunit E [Dehalococcoidia bacterium]|nr:NAD(P)H-dependent oxidoreductase subunit E [Dehalococcoidia bacterium]
MDLHLIPNAVPDDAERAAVDALLGEPEASWQTDRESGDADSYLGRSGHEARKDRHLLLPVLEAVQRRVGYITPGALNYICQRLEVPPAEAYGVATFYSLIHVDPTPSRVAHVCDDLACRMKGGLELCAALEQRFGPANEPALDGQATWKHSPCLGLCELAPAVLVQQAGEGARDAVIAPASEDAIAAQLTSGGVADVAIRREGSISAPQTLDAGGHDLRLLARVGRVDPSSLDEYRAAGGYAALRQALDMGSAAIIREVLESGLQGRGGAAFPTGRKWQDVASAAVRPHYLVANADESEPGTFSNRVIMEEDPFSLIESMTIAGFAVGAEQGYIYIRGEYPLAAVRLQNAIDTARRRGFLGANIMSEGVDFDIELRAGAGAYICGEETALFNSIEGLRGEPRNKPPFPTQVGLFGKPTVINNVETLVNVADIVLRGGPAFAETGTAQSKGTKLFCVSGAVQKPGVYEVPFGVTLRELLDMAGGLPRGESLRAVLLGGAAGGFVTPDELDVPLTFEGTRAINSSLGSGVVMPIAESADLQGFVSRIGAFFRDESCGQCVPCRVGTERQEESLQRLIAGRPLGTASDEVVLIGEIAQVMRDASICGLGQTAASAVQSAIEKLGVFQNGRTP